MMVLKYIEGSHKFIQSKARELKIFKIQSISFIGQSIGLDSVYGVWYWAIDGGDADGVSELRGDEVEDGADGGGSHRS